jgi:hypothetical protein
MSFKKPTLGKTVLGYAKNADGSVKMPLKFGDGVMLYDADSKGKTIYVSGRDVFLPDVTVKTSYDEFLQQIKTTTKGQATHIFPQVWNNIKNVDVDKLYEEQGQAWTDLCNDIVIYYVCRYKLFNTPAPVVKVE